MQWEELTATDFATAVRETGVCVIALGVIEKHSEHLPLGTDPLQAEHTAIALAEKVGGVLIVVSKNKMAEQPVMPPRTVAELQKDKQRIEEERLLTRLPKDLAELFEISKPQPLATAQRPPSAL